MPSTSTLITATTVTLLVGLAGYAIYFDYVRRNDPEFRRRLRKEKKRVDKSTASMKAAADSAAGVPTSAELREAVDTIRAEKLPETADGREKYFASNLATAEQLGLQNKILPAATCLYRAIRVYPQPVELMIALEQNFPAAVFKAVMEMMTLEVSPLPSAAPKTSAASDSASATSSRESTRRSKKKSDTTGTSSGKSSPGGTGPPSETSSSYEWDKVTEPDSSATPPPVPQGQLVA